MLSPPCSGIPGRWACTGALRVGDPYFKGPSVLDSGWEQRCEDGVLTYSTQRNRLRKAPDHISYLTEGKHSPSGQNACK